MNAEEFLEKTDVDWADQIEFAEAYASHVTAYLEQKLAQQVEIKKLNDQQVASLTKERDELQKEQDLYAILRGICEDVIDWYAAMASDGTPLSEPLAETVKLKLQKMYEHPLDNKLLIRTDQIEAMEARVESLEKKLEAFTDWDKEQDALLGELKYIADSPSPEHGGFHERVTAAARGAVSGITSLRARVESLTQENEKIRSQLGAADAYFPDAAIARVNAVERAERLEKALKQLSEGGWLVQDVREIARKALQEGK